MFPKAPGLRTREPQNLFISSPFTSGPFNSLDSYLLPSLPAPRAAGYVTGDSALFMTTDYFLILDYVIYCLPGGLWSWGRGGGERVDRAWFILQVGIIGRGVS